jgi:hypothetical protein
MIMRAVFKSVVPALALSLAACASSPPVHFHTLSAMDEQGNGNRAQPDLRYRIGTVDVPERLNRVDIVVSGREADVPAGKAGTGQAGGSPSDTPALATSVTLLENNRWDAPFADALRDALGARLAVAAASSAAAGSQPAQLRLSLQVYRFDASRSGDVDALVDWRLRRTDASDDTDAAEDHAPAGLRVLSCRYQGYEHVKADDVDALVAGMQRQVARLADDIVASTRPWLRDDKAGCVQAAGGA